MAEATETKTKTTAEVLQQVYKNVRMASESILTLMPSVTDETLKSDMTVQLSAFEAFASRTAKLLSEEGAKPEEESAFARLSAKWGTKINAMKDSSPAHIAEMMIEGATMGVNDMLREIRASEGGGVSENAVRLARDVCEYEEKIIEQMKTHYLR